MACPPVVSAPTRAGAPGSPRQGCNCPDDLPFGPCILAQEPAMLIALVVILAAVVALMLLQRLEFRSVFPRRRDRRDLP